jgi:hypothetical protein
MQLFDSTDGLRDDGAGGRATGIVGWLAGKDVV